MITQDIEQDLIAAVWTRLLPMADEMIRVFFAPEPAPADQRRRS